MTSTLESQASAAYAQYDATTSRWGRITMACGLVLSLAGPAYLVLFTDLALAGSDLLTGFLAVAAVFGVFWVLEPLTYFPVLGPAAMYQAFMIGNIANKLLPSAIVAQIAVDAKPGTKRGELAAVTAICGAAVVHIVSLTLFVGILGTWLVSQIPEDVRAVTQLYIFPAIIGAVVVQIAVFVKQHRITFIALTTALVVQLLLVPRLPVLASFATALVVVATMVVAWVSRDRSAHSTPETTSQTEPGR